MTDATAIVVETVEVVSIESVEIGQQGPPGPPGPESVITATAGEALSGQRAVRLTDAQAYYCDGDTVAHAGTCVGITQNAALLGATVTIQNIGKLTDPTFALTEGPLFVGTNGALSTTPGSAFSQEIARAVSATSIAISIKPAILRG